MKERAIEQGKTMLRALLSLHKFSLEYDRLLLDAIEQNSIQEKAPEKRDRTKRGKIRTLADRLIAYKREVLCF